MQVVFPVRRCGSRQATTPGYWVTHIDPNKKRDRKVNRTPRKGGHLILRLWNTDVKKRPGWYIVKIKSLLEI